MLEIDGSLGEGGGQVLRTALALSSLTNNPVRITNIRAGREKPGLRAQHLKAVDAAAAISKARVEGAALNSMTIAFIPSEIRTGRYRFDIGTAGSTSLVLQTILIPLSLATSASSVSITGGTHVPWAPCYHYLELSWLPVLNQIGYRARLSMDSAGFYPQGGGRISATIRPAKSIQPIQATQRGALQELSGISAVANLDRSIAERQKRSAIELLQRRSIRPKIKTLQFRAHSKGSILLLMAQFTPAGEVPSQCCYFSLGERGKPAEQVAAEAVTLVEEFLDGDATVDQYLADQLLLPLALAEGTSEFKTAKVTGHLVTNAAVIQTFLPAEIRILGNIGNPGLVRVAGAGFPSHLQRPS